MPDVTPKYESQKRTAAQRSRVQSLAGRDLGEIPAIADLERRTRCRSSLRVFCETYNPEAFYLGWSTNHLKAMSRIEEAVGGGALYAFAMPRGSGKTTLCRMAILWAISYSLVRYCFLIGANAGKAEDTLDAVKTFIRFLPAYAEDFPEISYPAIALGGIANRSSGQVCDGESTLIAWGKDRVVLPTVPPPSNWPKDWPLRADGMVPTSGAIIGVSGLTGDGIRGSVQTLTTGEQIRPDLVLLDDPQSDESAASVTQNASREALIAGAVLGMAGPDRTISAVMPCTVIRPGDMIDCILDRSKHPLWRGERCKMLTTMPADLAAWDAYFDLRNEDAQREPPDYSLSNAYYVEHREALDAGAEASWPERKLPGEVSAIQHAMNLYSRNRRAFMAEYQNDPLPDIEGEPEVVTAATILEKLNRHERRVPPISSTKLTAFIDVQQTSLWWLVAAWAPDFTGAVIDYGVWPDPKRSYFTLADIKVTLQMATGSQGLEGAIFGGLAALTSQILGRSYERDDGANLKIDRCLIDANWGQSTDTVYKFCRESVYSSVLMPSHGKFVGPGGQPFSEYKRKPGEQTGLNWRIPNVQGKRAVRHVLFDTNAWKSFVYARLAVPRGDRGALELFGDRADVHRMLADHWTAETRDRQTSEKTERKVDVWSIKMGRPDNHWFDCIVGAAVAAEMMGVRLPEAQTVGGPRRPKKSIAEMQAEARKRRA